MTAKMIGNAKLTAADAVGMRKRVAEGTSTAKAEQMRFRVSMETVRRVLRYETFANAGDVAGLPALDGQPAMAYEPGEGEIEASKAKFLALQKEAEKTGRAGADLLEQMAKGKRPANPLDEA